LPGARTGAVADPEDVRVDGDGRLAERDVHHHFGGLAADARQRLQLLVGVRHLAAMVSIRAWRGPITFLALVRNRPIVLM
jgi:hypothetical protein